MAAPFRLYNTLTRMVEPFDPLEPGRILLYVCGVTVYDNAHIGHARAMVVFDVIVRYLRHRGWDVRYVRNFTDVDDKIINRAAELGEDPLTLSRRCIASFRRDADALGLIPPTEEPLVSQSIDAILELIQMLVDREHAYVSEGSVWFAVETNRTYGKLSGQKVEELRNADVGAKRAAADFALWKAAKPGEPAWDSPWGPGRPGWHIECSAMARSCLGDKIDIHGGGLDLVFPHHENEIAQSECGTGREPFARYWMHNGLLTMNSGEKMGKSLGNVVDLVDLLQLYPAEALWLYYLQDHYRSPLPWNEAALPDALSKLARLYEAREVAEQMEGTEDPDAVVASLGRDARTVLELGRAFEDRFHAVMDDDFNTAQALGYAFELARAINRFSAHKKAGRRGGPVVAPALAGLGLLQTFGLLTQDPAAFQEEVKDKRLAAMGLSRDEVERLIADRATARAERDWGRADSIRAQLTDLGIAVMDRARGEVEWRVRL
ncbi:MAG: cysteine--tRNA ligase [Deltaproteobacteria bacterium]|nr:cysteine--tRNA ligase [Deltaproteobacteria bacterium]